MHAIALRIRLRIVSEVVSIGGLDPECGFKTRTATERIGTGGMVERTWKGEWSRDFSRRLRSFRLDVLLGTLHRDARSEPNTGR